MKNTIDDTTMLGPAGVSHSRDAFSPTITEQAPITEARTAMASESANRLAVTAG